MAALKTLLKILAALVAVVVLVAVVGYIWATMATNRTRSRTVDTYRVDFPIPFPMTEEEAAGLDPDAKNMTDVERQALWAYLWSVPPLAPPAQ